MIKVASLERSLTSNDGDRRKLLDQINKLKSNEMRLDNEIKRLKESNELADMKECAAQYNKGLR